MNLAADPINTVQTDEVFAFPLSPSQERIWAADCQNPGNPAYNASFRLRLQGRLDPVLFERVIHEIVRRHEVLRTTICTVEAQTVQLVRSSIEVPLKIVDLRSMPPPERDAEMERLCLEEACAPFDLSAGPLIRVGLLRMEDEGYVFTLSLHHIVCDGWSLGILLNEIEALYRAFAAGQPSPLPEPAIQYADYVVWQKEWLQNADYSAQLSYWRRQLKNYRPYAAPTDFPRAPGDTFNGNIISIKLPRGLTDGLKDLNTRQGSTMFSTTLAAFLAVLARYTGNTDITVGSPTAGRDRPDIEGMPGLFLNPVVLRTDLSGDPTMLELLDRVRETVLDAFANRDIPYEHLLRILQPGVDPFARPFYRVNFICQREYGRASTFVQEFAGVSMQSMPSKCPGTLYDIQCFMVERGDGWRLSCEFNTDLYKEHTAHRVLEHFRETLESMAGSLDQRISQIPLTGEMPQLAFSVDEFAGTGFEAPASLSQQRFWLLEKLSANPAHLHMPASVRIHGPMNSAVLQRALDELARRYEILRTSFRVEKDRLCQVVAPAGTIPLEVVSLEHIPELEREVEALRRLRDEPHRLFDLSSGPLGRAILIRLSADDHVLQVTLHHIISDGWSQGMLQRQLWEVYSSFAAGHPSPLPKLKLQYSDYAQAQRDWLATAAGQPDLDYWKEKLRGPLPVLQVPTDRPVSRHQSASCGTVVVPLPTALAESLRSFVKRESITAFTLMLACFKALLFHYSGQSDIIVGSPIANRNEETEGLIGPFASPIALRSDLSGDPSFRDFVAQLVEVILDAFAHKDIPFERVLEEIDARPVKGRNPIFQFYFYYQVAFLQAQEIDGLKITPLTTVGMGTNCELQLGFIERPSGVSATLEYNAHLFDESTMRRLLQHFHILLEQALASPDQPISKLLAPLQAIPLIESAKPEPQPESLLAIEPVALETGKGFGVPRDEIEIELVRIWQELFPNHQVSVTANFFDIGGHSLLASRLLLQIESTFRKKFTLSTLFEAPTIQHLAALLRAPTPVKRSPHVLPIQPKGNRPPFYCVDAGPFFRPLANYLGEDQPFFGLRLEETVEFQSPYRLEDIAAHHIRNLREVQPEGPYYLGGWCLSGVVAYEMAQQLRAMGAVVPLVAMFDCPNPSYFRNLSTSENLKVKFHLITQKLALHWTRFRQLDGRLALRYVWERVESVLMNHRRRFWRLSYWLQTGVRGKVSQGLKDPLQVVFLASRQYDPKPYDGAVDLFLGAAEPWGPYRDRNFGWAKLVRGEFAVHVMPGDHSEMFLEPGAGLLAERLHACLAAAQERSAGHRQVQSDSRLSAR